MPHDRLELLDVGRAALGRRVDDDADVGGLGGRAVGSADDAKTRAPTSRASSIARTRFTETLCVRLPPPTENTRIASREEMRDVRSHASKLVSQPSSFVRAVISATLSVGVYASKSHSFRKSLTACDACAAPPPTPRMKSRP